MKARYKKTLNRFFKKNIVYNTEKDWHYITKKERRVIIYLLDHLDKVQTSTKGSSFRNVSKKFNAWLDNKIRKKMEEYPNSYMDEILKDKEIAWWFPKFPDKSGRRKPSYLTSAHLGSLINHLRPSLINRTERKVPNRVKPAQIISISDRGKAILEEQKRRLAK